MAIYNDRKWVYFPVGANPLPTPDHAAITEAIVEAIGRFETVIFVVSDTTIFACCSWNKKQYSELLAFYAISGKQ